MSIFSNFLENFYGVLFSPDRTFDEMKKTLPLFQGFLVVVFISSFNAVINFDFGYGFLNLVILGLAIFFSAFGGVVSWLFFATFLDILASIFNQTPRIKTFLTLSGFALIPWIFLGPVELFKSGGLLSGIFGIFMGLIIWLWAIVLMFTAIIKTYELSFGRALTLMIVPFISIIIAFNWIGSFFSTLYHIIKV